MLGGKYSASRKYENVVALNLEDSISDYLSFAFPKGSEFVDLFNSFLVKLRQSGILTKINQKWAPVSNSKEVMNTPESGTILGFENLSFPFNLLATGIIIGATVALVEKINSCKNDSIT